MKKFIIKNIMVIFIIYILLGGHAIGEILMSEIRVQVRPIYTETENKKQHEQLSSNDYNGGPLKYQEIKNREITDKLKNTISENVQPVRDADFNVNLLNDTICQSIKNNLASNTISIVSNKPDITIEIVIEKTTVDSFYGPKLIPDTVTYKAMGNERVLFSGEFKQNYKFPFGSTKTPEQIGAILAKKITQEIKKLDR